MRTKQKQINNLSLPLRVKIIAGYGLLLILLGSIVFLVWLEHRKIETLNNSEQLIRHKREAVNRTFERLLDFSFSDDFLLLRDKGKFNEYRMKREVAVTALNELKLYYRPTFNILKSTSSLLLEKETLLFGVVNNLLSNTLKLIAQGSVILAMSSLE